MNKTFWILFWAIFAACATGILWMANWLDASGLINRGPNDLVGLVLLIGLFLLCPLASFASAFAAAEVEHQLRWWHN